MHLNQSNGYWYVRRDTGDGKETVAKLGQHDNRPAIYRPQLIQDKAENVCRWLPDDSVDCVIADPPYGIDFEWGDTAFKNSDELGTVANDTTLEWLPSLVDSIEQVLAPDSHIYIFTRWDAYPPMADAFAAEFEENTLIVWVKTTHGMGDLSDWAPQHEFLMHFEHGEPSLNGRRPTNVLEYDSKAETGQKIHPTQKPRELLEYLIKKSTNPGDVVFDPFGGSYATARAAMRTFRRGVSCELDPETHRAGEGLVERQLHDDPEYACDWTDITGLRVEDVAIAEVPVPA